MSNQLPNGLWSDFNPQEDGRVKANANFHQLDWSQWKCITAQVATPGDLPGSPSVGDSYLVGDTDVHVWYNSMWNIFTPPCAFIFYDQTLNEFFINNSGITQSLTGLIISLSNFIVGPVTSVVGNIPTYNNGTGNLAQDSGVNIDQATKDMTGVNDFTNTGAMNIGGNVTILGTGPHVVDPSFANEVWEKTQRPTGASVGKRGIAVSAESGNVTESTTTPQDIGVIAEIETTGRAVEVYLTCDSSSGYIRGEPDGSAGSYYPFLVNMEIYRDGTKIWDSAFGVTCDNGAAQPFQVPPSVVKCIDTGVEGLPGTYQYTFRFAPSSSAGTSAASVDNIKIVAKEV